MTYIDISAGVSPSLPVWPGDPPIVLSRLSSIADGDDANVSHLAAGVHVGTHVDAPVHFVAGGSSIADLSLAVLIGEAWVVEFPEANIIDAKALMSARIPVDAERLLLKTRNQTIWASSHEEFVRDYVAVSDSGAEWLVDHGVRLVGIDYLSIAPWGASVPTHRILLGAGVVVIEGLVLNSVTAGRYRLTCLPMKLLDSDGAPARAVLEPLP
ncbi:MAG: cyclase family protein [Anaerolineales bacterium]